jgi:hypothetical protein
MALLATLQDASILPAEGTPRANRVIQIVIQFQGVFMNSTDPAVRQFLDQALASKFADRTEEAETEFRQGGWTSQVLEAICHNFERRAGQVSSTFRSCEHAIGGFGMAVRSLC